jgi:hypothetical protein
MILAVTGWKCCPPTLKWANLSISSYKLRPELKCKVHLTYQLLHPCFGHKTNTTAMAKPYESLKESLQGQIVTIPNIYDLLPEWKPRMHDEYQRSRDEALYLHLSNDVSKWLMLYLGGWITSARLKSLRQRILVYLPLFGVQAHHTPYSVRPLSILLGLVHLEHIWNSSYLMTQTFLPQ